MPTRRLSLLTSLLLTAALVCALPALWQERDAGGRAQERLLPPRAHTLTVWLNSDDICDRRLINSLCAEYEKRREGVRVFLRHVDAQELNDPGGVPPDVALYSTGALRDPERKLTRLTPPERMRQSLISAGTSGGERYALPLWYEAGVLAFPYEWLKGDAPPTPRAGSLLGLQTPAPAADAPPFEDTASLPWRKLLAPGALKRPEGFEWQQLIHTCPASVRAELAVALKAAADGAPAYVGTYSRIRLKDDPTLSLCALTPAASHMARMASIMSDGEQARDFLRFLLDDAAQEAALAEGLMPAMPPVEIAESGLAALSALYSGEVLIANTFEHTREELCALCEDAALRLEEPTLTLIKLR